MSQETWWQKSERENRLTADVVQNLHNQVVSQAGSIGAQAELIKNAEAVVRLQQEEIAFLKSRLSEQGDVVETYARYGSMGLAGLLIFVLLLFLYFQRRLSCATRRIAP